MKDGPHMNFNSTVLCVMVPWRVEFTAAIASLALIIRIHDILFLLLHCYTFGPTRPAAINALHSSATALCSFVYCDVNVATALASSHAFALKNT